MTSARSARARTRGQSTLVLSDFFYLSSLFLYYQKALIDLLAGVPDSAEERGGGELLWTGQGGGHAHSIHCSGNQI